MHSSNYFTRNYCAEQSLAYIKVISLFFVVVVVQIFRKAALKFVEKGENVKVEKDNLKDFVGTPIFSSDRMYEDTPVGITTGLAWTSMGG